MAGVADNSTKKGGVQIGSSRRGKEGRFKVRCEWSPQRGSSLSRQLVTPAVNAYMGIVLTLVLSLSLSIAGLGFPSFGS